METLYTTVNKKTGIIYKLLINEKGFKLSNLKGEEIQLYSISHNPVLLKDLIINEIKNVYISKSRIHELLTKYTELEWSYKKEKLFEFR